VKSSPLPAIEDVITYMYKNRLHVTWAWSSVTWMVSPQSQTLQIPTVTRPWTTLTHNNCIIINVGAQQPID